MTTKTRIKNAERAINPPGDTDITVTLGDGTQLVTVNGKQKTFAEAARRYPKDYIFVTRGADDDSD